MCLIKFGYIYIFFNCVLLCFGTLKPPYLSSLLCKCSYMLQIRESHPLINRSLHSITIYKLYKEEIGDKRGPLQGISLRHLLVYIYQIADTKTIGTCIPTFFFNEKTDNVVKKSTQGQPSPYIQTLNLTIIKCHT